MKRFEILNQLDNIFKLRTLYKLGIVNFTELRDRDLFLQYDIYLRSGKPIMDAYYQTADDFGVSLNTVKRAVHKMTKDEKDSNSPK